MQTEWLLLCLPLIAIAWILLSARPRSIAPLPFLSIVAAASLLSAILWYALAAPAKTSRTQLLNSTPKDGGPYGYVSSDHCRSCHPSEYDSWRRTFHRTMTQRATQDAVLGDFNNARLELLGQTYLLQRRGQEFWVEMDDPDAAPPPSQSNPSPPARRVERRLSLLTGSHHMQVYWFPSAQGNLQSLFPFAWLIEDQKWVPFHNTFLRDPAIPLVKQSWNLNCINCHVTAGQPRPNHQTRAFETQTAELGIACEACHGPAHDHVAKFRDLTTRYTQHFSKEPDPSIINPAKLNHKASSEVCGQCHGIKWIPDRQYHLQHGFRFRPGQDLSKTEPIVQPTRLEDQPWLKAPLQQEPSFLRDRYWSDGMVRVSGREYNGLIDSPCFHRGQLSCLSCHSMHHSDPNDQLAPSMDGNVACLQCHQSIGNDLARHTRHAPGSSGSLCYNCHMPHTTYGLLKAIRSHQIDSPSALASIQTGRPNACNLCHLDKTLAWTAQHLSDWYQHPVPSLDPDHRSTAASLVYTLKGDAGQRALMAWTLGWPPAQEASGKDWIAPYLAHLLNDPYSAVRHIAHRSLKNLGPPFADFPYNFVAPPPELLAARDRVLELWSSQTLSAPSATPASTENPELLFLNGNLDQPRLQRLLRERNQTSMDLQE